MENLQSQKPPYIQNLIIFSITFCLSRKSPDTFKVEDVTFFFVTGTVCTSKKHLFRKVAYGRDERYASLIKSLVRGNLPPFYILRHYKKGDALCLSHLYTL